MDRVLRARVDVNAAMPVAMIDRRIAIAAQLAQLYVDDIEAAVQLRRVVDIRMVEEVGDLDDVPAMLAGLRVVEIAAELEEDLAADVIVAERAQQALHLGGVADRQP